MRRRIILQNTVTGQELVLPVTPPEYEIQAGRSVNKITMAMFGEVAVPGDYTMMEGSISSFFPAQDYPFNDPTTVTNPFYYIELLEIWSYNANPVRVIVSNTPVCMEVLLKPLQYTESGGVHDIQYTLSFTRYRPLSPTETYATNATGNNSQPAPTVIGNNAAASDELVTLGAGETLASVCRLYYGDSGYAAKLAKYNGMGNSNVVYQGMTIRVPEVGLL